MVVSKSFRVSPQLRGLSLQHHCRSGHELDLGREFTTRRGVEDDVVVTGSMGMEDVRHGRHSRLQVHGAILARTIGTVVVAFNVIERGITRGRFVGTGGVDETGLDVGKAGHGFPGVVESLANVGSSTAAAVEGQGSHEGISFLVEG